MIHPSYPYLNEVKVSETQNVLYLDVKRPDPKYHHKWRGSELLVLHTTQKAMDVIEKYRSERLFIKMASKRDIVCSVIVEDVLKNEDGTFMVKFRDIRRDHWVLPGGIKSFAGGLAVGPPPIPVPTN